jgi:putative oxidoreductase
VRNGTGPRHHGDVPALLLRMALGPMLVAHGYNKVMGSGGLEGTTKWFDSLGLRPAWLHARLAAATEITAGSLITIGAFNPAPAAAVIGLMATAAATDHRGKGFFVFKGGWEYTAVVATAAAALGSLGYGRFSVDHLRGRHRTGLRWALVAAAVGVGNSRALLATSFKPDQPA